MRRVAGGAIDEPSRQAGASPRRRDGRDIYDQLDTDVIAFTAGGDGLFISAATYLEDDEAFNAESIEMGGQENGAYDAVARVVIDVGEITLRLRDGKALCGRYQVHAIDELRAMRQTRFRSKLED